MSLTRLQLRQKLSSEIGDRFDETTTSAGAADGSTLVCSALKSYPDDYFNDWWVIPTLGTYKGVTKRISDFTQASGTVTVYAAWAGQILTDLTFELHRQDPTLLNNYINSAIENAYPFFYDEVIDDNLITGNILPNSNFEVWTAATNPDKWTKTANLTLTAETTTKWFGAKSCKAVAAAAAQYMYTDQSQYPHLLDLEGHSINIYVHAQPTIASATSARIQIVTVDEDGTSTTTNSSYHTGAARREILYIESLAIPDDLRSIAIQLTVGNGDTVYFDNAYIEVEGEVIYLLPTTFDAVARVIIGNDPDELKFIEDEEWQWWQTFNDGTDTFLELLKSPADLIPSYGYKMRLMGRNRFTAPSADTSTVDLTTERGNVIAIGAAALHFNNLLGGCAPQDVTRYTNEYNRRQFQFEQGKARFRMSTTGRKNIG